MNDKDLDCLAIGIGNIGNCYGGLSVSEKDGRYFWSIEDWNGHSWHEIQKTLFDELIKHNETEE